MKTRLAIVTLIVALLSVWVMAPGRAAAAGTNANAGGTLTIPIPTQTGSLGTLTNGALNITQFVSQNGQLFAVGNVTGTFTDLLGNVSQINIPFQAPVNILQQGGTCQILTLDIGAIHLDLLGLVVDLSPIHLSVTAQSGPGNLLGNLLCTIAHLLDQNNTNALAAILNALLGNLTATL